MNTEVNSFRYFLFFILMMGDPVANLPLFLLALLLGSMGLSSVLTMVAAIASRASQNFSLMAILSFPIILPFLGTLMKISQGAMTLTGWEGTASFIVILLTIDLSVILLAVILFPYLWKD